MPNAATPFNGSAERPFWQGRRVFLTGCTGFKGAWLALWLARMGAEVSGYSLPPPTDPNLFELARVHERIDCEFGDVRDLDRLRAALKRVQPSLVFHLAAQPLVLASYDDPVGTFATNIMGTVHLLEAIRQAGSVQAAIVVTSDKCYENREWLWPYREGEALGGNDPYSSSKACAEIVAAAYRASFFGKSRDAVRLATARAGNVIGGGDWSPNRLLPDCVRALGRNQPVRIRNPRSIRPWQHVLDALSGYILLAERLTASSEYEGAWNFGPDAAGSDSVEAVVNYAVAQWRQGGTWETEPAAAEEAQVLRLDSSKARTRLNWRPRLDLAATIRWTMAWYGAWADGADVHALSDGELTRYLALTDAPGQIRNLQGASGA